MPREIDPETPFREAGAGYMLAQCRKLAKHLPGARLGEDPEELHDVRVAIRRLRTAMTVFRACFPVRHYEFWYRRLSRLADALSLVRDQDVQIGLITTVREALPPDQQASVGAWLSEHAAQRAVAREEMIAVLDRWEADGLTENLRLTLAALSDGAESVTSQARKIEATLLAAPAMETLPDA